TARDSTLVTGPHPADAANRKLRKVIAGNRSYLPLLIRKGAVPGQSAVLFVRQRTVHKLGPEALQSTPTLNFESVQHEVRGLTCEWDASCRVIGVAARCRDRWEWQPARSGGVPARVIVRLAAGVREGNLELRCLAPSSGQPKTPSAWNCPGAALAGAVPRGETLEIWFHPDLRLSGWQSNDFRLVDSAHV